MIMVRQLTTIIEKKNESYIVIGTKVDVATAKEK
jgi:hypothetical protein